MDGKMRTGPSKLTIDCDICGEPMSVSRRRYVELIKAGQRPRCRKNGCERLCGLKNHGTARRREVLATVEIPHHVISWPSEKRGNKNGALAKLAVKRMTVEDCAECREKV